MSESNDIPDIQKQIHVLENTWPKWLNLEKYLNQTEPNQND